ncbi:MULTISPECIES: aspartate-semialdehyde dehydrogenase [Niallia]|jgi:aspartate-semialdehyde dehydrogenase|uniref:Aspartate-semialdehyde dehydrogenase n=1 Tax=Niallia circulans TaxID=1397 RepID=A0A268FFY7_NIACI|nr:aspartate-semialdehyde dehydrogenase [Niallia circulans]AYV66060.1 aspartate-semialdehyde dehydrogenase [Niallia circulans]AYV71121.1 aspartate-semialdehyde dehydrogenase [Niallia circulans]NRG26955.1 aspartate-semialdehyde dehydrogenase [Niallia circulans]PAD84288.1 aspartate-semialdehyde dehydrogenase [Niallia circulans]QJX61955.1 aspartate-semialdehyde dehydrogenase [Niallia circulans]
MEQLKGFNVAVVGATGAVGQQMIKTLESRDFPISTLTLLSSKRSAGTKVQYKDKEIVVQEATPESFKGIDIALFSAGGGVSKELAPHAVRHGAIVVDNTSAFRMDKDVPLVVPEVNEEDLREHNGIIANPNCSTIQMVVALQPLKEKFGLSKVLVSTYQAVSGSGAAAVEELNSQTQAILNKEAFEPKILPVKSDKKHYQIAFNAVPQIDVFTDNGFTYEEMKMINETKKIMHADDLKVAATCVRIPVATGHSESVYFELDNDQVSVEEIKSLLADAPGIVLQDDPSNQVYPMPADCVGSNDVFVGRIRQDLDVKNGFHMWVVSDNLLKGAAWNSVQIAESLIKLGLV